MGRTKFIVLSSQRYNLGYFGQTKRRQVAMVKRKAHHSLRVHNRYADELNHISFKRFKKRTYYQCFCPENWTLQLRLRHYRKYLGLQKESLKKILQQSLRKIKNEQISEYDYWRGKSSRFFAPALKKLTRRCSLKPFLGHRETGTLYKRQLACWQQ